MTGLGPRVVVVGISGTGKSTVAKELARRLGAPHVELDSLVHGPGWVSTPDEVLFPRVTEAAAGERWVVDGNYAHLRPLVWPRATDVVWLDYPRGLATWRAARRTVGRVVRRTELWNGNTETLREVLRSDHPIWWSWRQHPAHRAEHEEAVRDPRWPHLTVTRLRTPAATERWLRYRAWP